MCACINQKKRLRFIKAKKNRVIRWLIYLFIFNSFCLTNKQRCSVALMIKICEASAAGDSCCRIKSALVFNRFKSDFAVVVTDVQ